MKMVFIRQSSTYALWRALQGLFLDNADQRAVYALQEFHRLFQGDMSITDYFGRLKQLTDLLHDVGHPVSEPALVINALRGLNSKFSQTISTLTVAKPLPSFLFVRNYLLQDENRQFHTAKMEAATTLMATTNKGAPATSKPPTPPGSSPPSAPPAMNGNNNNNNRRKKLKQSNGRDAPSGNSASGSNKPVTGHPWIGMVQAWPMLHWCPVTSGLLGMRPPLPPTSILLRLASTPPSTTPRHHPGWPWPSTPWCHLDSTRVAIGSWIRAPAVTRPTTLVLSPLITLLLLLLI
jgi:hypothetical protein